MKILVAYSESAVSVIHAYEYATTELIDSVIDLSRECDFSCSHVLVVEDQKVVYEFIRGVSPKVSKREDIEFKPVRATTMRDMAIIKRAWEKSLSDLKCAGTFM